MRSCSFFIPTSALTLAPGWGRAQVRQPGTLMPSRLPPPPRTGQGVGKRRGPTSGTLGAGAQVSPGKGVLVSHAVRGLQTGGWHRCPPPKVLGVPGHQSLGAFMASSPFPPPHMPQAPPPICRCFPHPCTSTEVPAPPAHSELEMPGSRCP